MKNKQLIFILLGVSLLGLFTYDQSRFFDDKLYVVFCNVGQGDAIFIRMPRGSDVLVDGGPNEKVLDCLQKHMPFWDRTIELMFLSHPHDDHFKGLIEVISRYKVDTFASELLINDTMSYKGLQEILVEAKVKTKIVYTGDMFKIADGVKIEVLAPTKEFIRQTSPGGKIGERDEFANVILHIQYQSFDLLLTGDSQVGGLKQAVENLVGDLEVLQIPHHGSRTGINQELLELLKPDLAVISVGAKNRYGHPHPSIIKLLEDNKIPYKRTDRDWDIEVVSDEKQVRILRNLK